MRSGSVLVDDRLNGVQWREPAGDRESRCQTLSVESGPQARRERVSRQLGQPAGVVWCLWWYGVWSPLDDRPRRRAPGGSAVPPGQAWCGCLTLLSQRIKHDEARGPVRSRPARMRVDERKGRQVASTSSFGRRRRRVVRARRVTNSLAQPLIYRRARGCRCSWGHAPRARGRSYLV